MVGRQVQKNFFLKEQFSPKNKIVRSCYNLYKEMSSNAISTMQVSRYNARSNTQVVDYLTELKNSLKFLLVNFFINCLFVIGENNLTRKQRELSVPYIYIFIYNL